MGKIPRQNLNFIRHHKHENNSSQFMQYHTEHEVMRWRTPNIYTIC